MHSPVWFPCPLSKNLSGGTDVNFSIYLIAGFVFLVLLLPCREAVANFMIQDGERVVFLGDSLTATRGYTDLVELYTFCTYPNRSVEFINAGIGGDTAERGLKRLRETVLDHKPTLITVCYGINDIGWGMLADEEHYEKYMKSMEGIVSQCQEAGARVVVMSPCATQLGEPDKVESNPLNLMGRRVLAMAEERGAAGIDLYNAFTEIQVKIRRDGKDEEFQTHAGDGIHLSDFGNLVFAYVLLKGLGAPDVISSATLDAETARVANSYRCQISDLEIDGEKIRFTRLDEGWPMFLGPFAGFQFPYVPSGEELSRYELKVTGLPEHEWYDVQIDGKTIATLPREDIEAGVNLSYMAAGLWDQIPPWRALGEAGRTLMKARTEAHRFRSTAKQINPNDGELSQNVNATIEKVLGELDALKSQLNAPRPLRYELRPGKKPE